MFLYIHGFLSSPQSAKAQQLKQWLDDRGRVDEWICPQLSAHPREAIIRLTEIVEQSLKQGKEIKLVGSSLGGFYATILGEKYNLKTVVVNPSINPAKTLAQKIGTHTSWHSDAQIEFTRDDVLTLQQLRCAKITRHNNFMLMVEKNDEVLNYEEAVKYFDGCNQLIFNGGDHSFTRFEPLLELINVF